MKAQILRHSGDPDVDSQVRFVRRHSEQFGDGREFAAWVDRRCPKLCAIYCGETGRVCIVSRGPKEGDVPGFPWSTGEPLAIWEERPQWSVEPGRLVYLNGRLVFALSRPDNSAGSPADVDSLAHKIVALLNANHVEL